MALGCVFGVWRHCSQQPASCSWTEWETPAASSCSVSWTPLTAWASVALLTRTPAATCSSLPTNMSCSTLWRCPRLRNSCCCRSNRWGQNGRLRFPKRCPGVQHVAAASFQYLIFGHQIFTESTEMWLSAYLHNLPPFKIRLLGVTCYCMKTFLSKDLHSGCQECYILNVSLKRISLEIIIVIILNFYSF